MTETVLIVEDSPVQGEALRQLLEEHGFRVLWARNGQEGVTLAQIHLPDFVVMDLEMPEMNGFEACRHLKANFTTRDIPVIMLTAKDMVEHLDHGFDVGAIDFIPKDMLSGAILLDTLKHLDGRRQVDER